MTPSFFEESRKLVEGEVGYWKAQFESAAQQHQVVVEQLAAQLRARMDDASQRAGEVMKHQMAVAEQATTLLTNAFAAMSVKA